MTFIIPPKYAVLLLPFASPSSFGQAPDSHSTFKPRKLLSKILNKDAQLTSKSNVIIFYTSLMFLIFDLLFLSVIHSLIEGIHKLVNIGNGPIKPLFMEFLANVKGNTLNFMNLNFRCFCFQNLKETFLKNFNHFNRIILYLFCPFPIQLHPLLPFPCIFVHPIPLDCAISNFPFPFSSLDSHSLPFSSPSILPSPYRPLPVASIVKISTSAC